MKIEMLLPAVLLPLMLLCSCRTVCNDSAQDGLPKGKKWKLVWSDEFNGTELDKTKWGFRRHLIQQKHDTFCGEEGVQLDGKGFIHLNLIEKDGQFYSPHMQTGENFLDRPGDKPYSRFLWPVAEMKPAKFTHSYGYYEIRCKLQKKPGWWSAFWLQSPIIGASLDAEKTGVEIDIMENFTRDGKVSSNIHWGGYAKNHEHKGSGHIQLDSQDGFRTYGLDWSKDGYTFYIDGEVSWKADGPVSDVEQFILISTECMGYRQSKDKPSPKLKKENLPDAFVVDYVRVYDEVE
ncbi:MAG: glycoside hydrolase family 16 protein [Kiritimatiellae bacterium]|jgi:hypothetical protein|nr:glycoside hydrolase family 16 protein [Kiritimatiellia bacterium]